MAQQGSARADTGRRGEAPPPPEPLPVEVVDSHCHLDLLADLPGPSQLPDALAAARAAGVRRVVTIGVDVETSRWQADVAASHPDVYAAAAIHPNEAPGLGAGLDEACAEIARLAARPEVRAVGETGLDYFRTAPGGRAAQVESFRRHIAIAKETGRTLVIHDREAHADVLRILAADGAPERVVFHAFSGDAGLAGECAAAGYLMSFAGNVTFKNAANLRAAAAVVPADLLLVETDAPFLTPVPWRGRPNGPYLVPLTVRALADARGADVADVATAIAANAERMFGPW